MTIIVNNKNTFDTAATTANKSIGFDPRAINLVLMIYARDIGRTRTIMMRKNLLFCDCFVLVVLVTFF